MTNKSNSKSGLFSSFIAVTILFFLWGFITVLVDSLVPRLKEVFELEYWQAALVQMAWFTAYLLVSIPGGSIIGKIGYKKGIVLGLGMIAVGCLMFYPAAGTRVYGLFLLALFVVASGITILQVAANPYISVLGPKGGESSRLNLAQAFNSLGTTIAPILAATWLLGDKIMTKDQLGEMGDEQRLNYLTEEASQVQGPFLLLAGGVFLLMVVFLMIKLPAILDQQKGNKTNEFIQALKHRPLVLGAIAIFLYVGAEVAIGSFLTNYFLGQQLDTAILESESLKGLVDFISGTFGGKSLDMLDSKGIVGSFLFFYWGGAMVGRFIGSYLTRVFQPSKVLSIFAFGAIALICISMASSGLFSMWAILAVGLFNSIMFPTIFTLAIDGLGELKPQGSGILCTAIFGGAVIPFFTGIMIDQLGFAIAFLLLTGCYGYIVWYGWKMRRSVLSV
jgi:MFS transporter, FHS family, L-fucose permease